MSLKTPKSEKNIYCHFIFCKVYIKNMEFLKPVIKDIIL